MSNILFSSKIIFMNAEKVSIFVLTCLCLLKEEVSQNVIINVVNYDKAAVVGEDVLLELLELLNTEDTCALLSLSNKGVKTCCEFDLQFSTCCPSSW